MRIFFTLFLLVQSVLYLSAQNKQDYHWFFGSDQSLEPGVQAIQFDFNQAPFEPSERMGGLEFDQNNASIADAEGNLLFYTNGCAVANREHEVMPNGDSLNWTLFFELDWLGDCGNGYPGRQDIMILEDPGNENGFYILQKPVKLDQNFNLAFTCLTFSYVDMTLDNGLGDLTIKDSTFLNGNLIWSYLTAIQHSNGKDWWILQPKAEENVFYRFLIDEQGIHAQDSLVAEHSYHPGYSGSSGECLFSPDGSKFVFFSNYDGIHLYDFDRTDGSLYNLRKTNPKAQVPQNVFGTVEFSSNSRFLYITNTDSLWQVDTFEENLEDGEVLIAVRDWPNDPFASTLFKAALGPDCKLYLRPGSGNRSFHVINHPNRKGLDCDFRPNHIVLPHFSSTGSFPNFPRWRVDDDEKCDSTIVNMFGELVYYRQDLHIFPNPAAEYSRIELPEHEKGQLMVYDLFGKKVYLEKEIEGFEGFVDLNVNEFPAGTYVVDFIPEDNEQRYVYSGQLVVVE